jgi:rhodanese/phosphatase family protein
MRRLIALVTDPARQPVFIHCRNGSDRTGTAIAVYRVAVEGWSREEAIDEMVQGGYGFKRLFAHLVRYVRGFRGVAFEKVGSCLRARPGRGPGTPGFEARYHLTMQRPARQISPCSQPDPQTKVWPQAVRVPHDRLPQGSAAKLTVLLRVTPAESTTVRRVRSQLWPVARRSMSGTPVALAPPSAATAPEAMSVPAGSRRACTTLAARRSSPGCARDRRPGCRDRSS